MLPIPDAIKLHKRRYRIERGLFLVEGKKIIEEVLKNNLEITQLYISTKFESLHSEFLLEHQLDRIPLVVASDNNIARLSSTETPSGIVAVVKLPTYSLDSLSSMKQLVAFEHIKDPSNLGTMIRTSDWFGVDGIITTTEGVDPFNDKVIRATMGSLFHVPIFTVTNLYQTLQRLKKDSFTLITTRPESENTLHNTPEKFCLIIGNESTGTTTEVDHLATEVLSIPGSGKAESLNAAVSFGIMMYQLNQSFS